ncbi:hypothetical protein I3843_03G154500 [Carya illinoinensis]|nr:hypothetical protein I3843_03G154500 [Carya illinoinensis]
MVINLSSYPPSSSYPLIRLTNSKLPISGFSLMPKTPKTQYPNSSFSFCYSFSPSRLALNFSNQFFLEKSRNPLGKRSDFRSWAISVFDVGDFENAQSVLESAAVLTAIIIVHESGHFRAAYLQGIHASKFAVGFEYSIRAFPLGGFLGFPDNDPESGIPVDDENLLNRRPVFDRVIVISAGVVANIIFAYVIIFIQVFPVGLPVREAFPGVLVPEVLPFSAASRDGLLPGDIILAVNGNKLPKAGPSAVSELVDVIKKNPKRNVLLKIERGEEDFQIGVTPDENIDGTGKTGVQLSPNVKISEVFPKNLLEAFAYTGKELWGLPSNVLDSLKQTFLNFSLSASKVSGPVAIIAVGAEVARSNIDGLYQFAAVLNINLAVINLLPFPALDGGSLALILMEGGGRKLPLELEQRIMSSGIMLVILLGTFLVIRDTFNLNFIKNLP